MRYTEWVDAVLAALDETASADGNAALVGLSWHELLGVLGVPISNETLVAVFNAGRDLELIGCAVMPNRLRIKVTTQGQRIARAGGLRNAWTSLFSRSVPLDEDRAVLTKVVEAGVDGAEEYATTRMVELKEAMRSTGLGGDQGSAIALAKRLESIGCIHREPLITAGPDGYCQVLPSYVGIIIATEKAVTELRALLDQLLSQWETTNAEVKESIGLDSDRQKAEFCKDILALANTQVSGRGFLIVGFNDDSRTFTTSVDSGVDLHRMESVLTAYCRPVPRISFATVPYSGGTAGILEVSIELADLPYRLCRDIWKLKHDSVFVRHNTLVAVAEGEELDWLIAEGERVRSRVGLDSSGS